MAPFQGGLFGSLRSPARYGDDPNRFPCVGISACANARTDQGCVATELVRSRAVSPGSSTSGPRTACSRSQRDHGPIFTLKLLFVGSLPKNCRQSIVHLSSNGIDKGSCSDV